MEFEREIVDRGAYQRLEVLLAVQLEGVVLVGVPVLADLVDGPGVLGGELLGPPHDQFEVILRGG